MIIIQHIETVWTKASRGMPGAGKRNAVPRKLEIPAIVLDSDGMLIYKVTAREQEDFVLVSGEWGAFHINGRFASYSGQHYTQHFLNIGNIAAFRPDLFGETEPNDQVNKMAHLFYALSNSGA